MSTRFLYALAAALLTTGCVSTVSIDFDDSSRFNQLAGSVVVNEESAIRLRFRGTEVSGKDQQNLDAGEQILDGDTAILGPTAVDLDLELAYYSIAIGSERQHDGFKLISYIGISQTDFDLTLTESGNRLHSNDHTTEVYAQLGFSRAVAESLQLGLTAALSLGRDVSGIGELDLTVDYALASNLVLSGGYRWFSYQYGIGDEDSTLEVVFKGPFIGLYLPF